MRAGGGGGGGGDGGGGSDNVMVGPGLPHLNGVVFPENASLNRHGNVAIMQNDIVEESFDDQELQLHMQLDQQSFNASPTKRRVHNLPVKSNGDRLGQLKGRLVARGQQNA